MGKSFEETDEHLQDLYRQAESFLESCDSDPSSVKALISKISEVYSDFERVVIHEADSSRKETLMASLKPHHVVQSKFNERATTWLNTAKVNETEIRTLLAGVRTLRSRSRCSSVATSSSS